MGNPICHNVLILADAAQLVRAVQAVLAARGVRGIVESDPAQALLKAAQGHWDMVIADASNRFALEALRVAKANFPERPVVLAGPEGDVAMAVDAMRGGCDDYLTTPIDATRLEQLIRTLLPNHDVAVAAAAEEDIRCLYQLAGRSRAFLDLLRLSRKVAPTSMPVLITGESGTGKELLSYLLHHQSNRRGAPYVRVNCAALSESLLESELFGHERGAFTGAVAQRKGRFERAHGGTLLLDEISETGPRLQAELLRVLEQQDFERVGGSESVQVNVRVVSTSNKDLTREVEQGRFRRDLFYRLAGVHLVAPPLRHRKDDLPVLVWHFVNHFSREVRRPITCLDEQMLAMFEAYHWPGNIRQLRNVVRTAMVLGEGPVLSLDGAESLLHDFGSGAVAAAAPAATLTPAKTLSLQELEKRAILEALERSQRNQVKAARLLGITDRTLREKLRRYRQEDQPQPQPQPTGELVW